MPICKSAAGLLWSVLGMRKAHPTVVVAVVIVVVLVLSHVLELDFLM
jgi:hypothetical protein